jgi:hypothetical protein
MWRKLKQLGAILLPDAVWVLPATPQTRERFQWMASEIAELGGEATVFVAKLDGERQQAGLVKEFCATVDDAYKEISAQLRRKNPDLKALTRRYQQTLAQDYFRSKLGDKVRRPLLDQGEKAK